MAVVGVAIVALYLVRYPPGWPAAPEVSMPDPSKAAAVAHSLLALVVVNLGAFGAAWPLQALWRGEAPALAGVLRPTLGLFALAHVVAVLGFAGWLSPRSVGLVAVSAALAGTVWLVRAARSRAPGVPALPRMRLVGWMIVAGLVLSLMSAFVPLYGWDALTYHLALPERFLREGSLVFDRYSPFTTFPLLTEMLYVLALALDGPALAKLLCVELGALLLAGLAVVGGRFGRAAGLFAVLCFLSDPLFLWETTVVYSDLSLGLLALMAAEALSSWDAHPSRRTAARAALFAGLCIAVRSQGAFVGVAMVFALLAGGRQPWRHRLRSCAGLAACALCLVSPWILRNVLHTGTALGASAFHPVFLRQMLAFTQHIGMGHGAWALLALPWNLTFRNTPGNYSGSFGYLIGPLFLVAGVMALSAVRASVDAALLLRIAGVEIVAWFFTVQESRYLLPALVALVLSGAIGVQRLAAASGRARAALAVAPVGALLLGQLWFWNASPRLYRMAFGDIPWHVITRATPAEVVGEMLRALRRPHVKALCLFESRSWHLRGVDTIPYHVNEGSPVLPVIHEALLAGRLCRWLADEGVTHLVVDTRAARHGHPIFVDGYTPDDWARDLDLLNRFLGSSADLRADVRGTLLFELRRGPACRDPDPSPRAPRVTSRPFGPTRPVPSPAGRPCPSRTSGRRPARSRAPGPARP